MPILWPPRPDIAMTKQTLIARHKLHRRLSHMIAAPTRWIQPLSKCSASELHRQQANKHKDTKSTKEIHVTNQPAPTHKPRSTASPPALSTSASSCSAYPP